jgi:hypothetical protein
MSTKREPLLSEYELQNRTAEYGHEVWGPYWNRDRVIAHYEAARDNDAELIQKLVNALHDLHTLDQLARHMSVRRITKRDATADITDSTGMLSIAHHHGTWFVGSKADDGQTTITSPAVIAKAAVAFAKARNVPSDWVVPTPPVPTSKVSPSKRTTGVYVERQNAAVEGILDALRLWYEWTGEALTFSRAMRSERPNGGRPPAWAKAAIRQARELGVPIDMG